MADLTRSRYAIHALDWIFQYPIFKSTHFVAHAGNSGEDRSATSESAVRGRDRENLHHRKRSAVGHLRIPGRSECRGGTRGVLMFICETLHHLRDIYGVVMIRKCL